MPGRVELAIGASALLGLAMVDPSPRRKVAELAAGAALGYLALRATPVARAATAAAELAGEGVQGLGEIGADLAALADDTPATREAPADFAADPAAGGFLLGAPRNLARISGAWRYPNEGQTIRTGLFRPNKVPAELAIENQSGLTAEGDLAALVTYTPASVPPLVLPTLRVTLRPGEFRVFTFDVPTNTGADALSIRPTWNGYGLGSLSLRVA